MAGINVKRGQAHVDMPHEVDDEAVSYSQEHTHKEKDRKSSAAPLALYRAADEVVKVKRNQRQKIPAVRNKGEGHQPPNLPAHDLRRGEGQKAHKRARGVHHSQQPDCHITYNYVYHQIRNAKARVPVAEQIDLFHEAFQARHPNISRFILIITFFSRYVHRKFINIIRRDLRKFFFKNPLTAGWGLCILYIPYMNS